ncbi:uncharacterized protein LOC132304270 [Cornus florida]|uniref:uncharacterized protein LOC132304270 n=1 Tax=Cornus florida TaxID=4283 RepID=UPI00289FBFD1|nr:uncharacterized protein LOC132304270 [Cornus florida]
MCSFVGLVRCINRESRRKKEFGKAAISLDFSVQLKDITVRIIHAGGREEKYQNAIPASQLMEKYPGMFVARPQVFKNPHEAVLVAEDMLLPGHKYFIIPSTTVQKLKRKHSQKGKVKESAEDKEAMFDQKTDSDASVDWSDESVCSAKDFSVSKEMWSECAGKTHRKVKKGFTPPIQNPRMWRDLSWEPSLTSIQELSP